MTLAAEKIRRLLDDERVRYLGVGATVAVLYLAIVTGFSLALPGLSEGI